MVFGTSPSHDEVSKECIALHRPKLLSPTPFVPK